jgi:hypothetical protein
MIRISINRMKIDPQWVKQDKDGKPAYLDAVLMDNKGGPDRNGNDGYIVQQVSKEAREAGERGPIIGNWKELGKPQARPQNQPSRTTDEEGNYTW